MKTNQKTTKKKFINLSEKLEDISIKDKLYGKQFSKTYTK